MKQFRNIAIDIFWILMLLLLFIECRSKTQYNHSQTQSLNSTSGYLQTQNISNSTSGYDRCKGKPENFDEDGSCKYCSSSSSTTMNGETTSSCTCLSQAGCKRILIAILSVVGSIAICGCCVVPICCWIYSARRNKKKTRNNEDWQTSTAKYEATTNHVQTGVLCNTNVQMVPMGDTQTHMVYNTTNVGQTQKLQQAKGEAAPPSYDDVAFRIPLYNCTDLAPPEPDGENVTLQ